MAATTTIRLPPKLRARLGAAQDVHAHVGARKVVAGGHARLEEQARPRAVGHQLAADPHADAARAAQDVDAVMRVSDPVGGGSGWCNMQTIVIGEWPELGLAAATSFI